MPVEVVADHEIEWKTSARVVLLVPITVRTLTLAKILGCTSCGQASLGPARHVSQ